MTGIAASSSFIRAMRAETWRCLELSAANSESMIYGYVKDGTPLAEKFVEFLSDGSEQLHTAILRLKIPSSLESERGVVIEDLISPHWINLGTLGL